MNSALQVVDMLLETPLVRVCANCEKEHGPVQVRPGERKSHGMCRRHAIEAYSAAGLSVDKIKAAPPESFPPDLSEVEKKEVGL